MLCGTSVPGLMPGAIGMDSAASGWRTASGCRPADEHRLVRRRPRPLGLLLHDVGDAVNNPDLFVRPERLVGPGGHRRRRRLGLGRRAVIRGRRGPGVGGGARHARTRRLARHLDPAHDDRLVRRRPRRAWRSARTWPEKIWPTPCCASSGWWRARRCCGAAGAIVPDGRAAPPGVGPRRSRRPVPRLHRGRGRVASRRWCGTLRRAGDARARMAALPLRRPRDPRRAPTAGVARTPGQGRVRRASHALVAGGDRVVRRS